jgi:hypothetical protein
MLIYFAVVCIYMNLLPVNSVSEPGSDRERQGAGSGISRMKFDKRSGTRCQVTGQAIGQVTGEAHRETPATRK